MLSKHWDHPSMYNMIMKLWITKGPNTLIPQEAIQLTFLKEGSNRISPRASSFDVLRTLSHSIHHKSHAW